ncbi:MerR family transcriptional regulator [Georgenia sp. TF02-10]|uniref:MerR family transcriptional regulator n=1 Tax=Georgenia sp. TF02-10 TaxID=2917725 RepID=UPI001FA6C583|nr:MerR family transcriptional regulator [Georgenia sp. TF02-10]UNX54305.1 MerR family transcriptional regulator [Georgenia sp. TF02-10]
MTSPAVPGRGGAPEPGPYRGGDGAPLTVAAVAARLGVAASTLRTWDRRYGLGPTAHEAGSHRRYSPADVARLERMRSLTLQGVAPADAARAALDEDGNDHVPAPMAVPVEEDHEPLLVDPLSLAAAAMEPDHPRVQRMLHQGVREKGLVRTWTGLVKPALTMLRQRERSDRPGVDPEELVSFAVLAAVREVAAAAERARASDADARAGAATGPRRTVLLCARAADRLRAHVVGGGLAERGVSSRVLRVEQGDDPEQVVQSVQSRGARVLAVVGDPPGADRLVEAVSAQGGVEIFLLGPDAPEIWLPRVRRVRTTPAAVEEIVGALEE